MNVDVRPGSVAAAIASVLGGDAWLIGLAWGGEDGAAMLALGACLVLVGVLVLAGTWPGAARAGRRPTTRHAGTAGAPAVGPTA